MRNCTCASALNHDFGQELQPWKTRKAMARCLLLAFGKLNWSELSEHRNSFPFILDPNVGPEACEALLSFIKAYQSLLGERLQTPCAIYYLSIRIHVRQPFFGLVVLYWNSEPFGQHHLGQSSEISALTCPCLTPPPPINPFPSHFKHSLGLAPGSPAKEGLPKT